MLSYRACSFEAIDHSYLSAAATPTPTTNRGCWPSLWIFQEWSSQAFLFSGAYYSSCESVMFWNNHKSSIFHQILILLVSTSTNHVGCTLCFFYIVVALCTMELDHLEEGSTIFFKHGEPCINLVASTLTCSWQCWNQMHVALCEPLSVTFVQPSHSLDQLLACACVMLIVPHVCCLACFSLCVYHFVCFKFFIFAQPRVGF